VAAGASAHRPAEQPAPVRARNGTACAKGGAPMNYAQLEYFRAISAAMQTEPTDWQWIGPHLSQRMFGITRTRAEAYATRHGGKATRMEDADGHQR